MSKEIKLLDCTLRDGGYVNGWDFGHSVITGTYKRLDRMGADYIEVGFLNDSYDFSIDRTIQPNTKSFDRVFENVKKIHATPVAMIDFGTCSLDNIDNCNDTFIDGIRVIFKKEKIDQALPFCQAIKEKGYKLFIQAISITAYSDIEMLQYVERINEIKPYAFSIVDTYGLLDKPTLTKYFYLIDNNLDSEIVLGYHAHNNFQLAFSNTIEFLSMQTKRTLVADSTVYGMGKSAGNCATELLAMHMNQYYEKKYDIYQVLEIIDTDLMTIYKENYWGYTYLFYISALHDCHPNYVQYLLDKKTLSVTAVNELLENIPLNKKLLFDRQYIHNAYVDYQTNEIDDANDFESIKIQLSKKEILVIGPGSSIATESVKINEFIDRTQPLLVSVNFTTDLYESDYIFISNSKRYSKLADVMAGRRINASVIGTSNVKELDYPIDYKLNYESLLMNNIGNADNALVLLLNLLVKCNISKVTLAGFDGFLPGVNNYYSRNYNFASDDKFKLECNKLMSEALTVLSRDIDITFLTNNVYKIGEKDD